MIERANELLHTVLQCLSDISLHYYYGAGILSAVLRGESENDKRIKARGLDKVSGYGKLANLSAVQVADVIDWAISQKYILRTKAQYPVLHPTYEGTHYSESISLAKLRSLLNSIPD